MMQRGRYVVALALALIALAPMTAQPARDAQGREIVAGKSYPDTWPEIKALNEWNPVPLSIPLPDGTRLLRSWHDEFGWFCYRTFVDPVWGPGRYGTYTRSLDEEMHGYFRVLAAACTGDPTFGNALRLLCDNVDVFAHDVPPWSADRDQASSLSNERRARLLEVAKAMHRVMASNSARRETKAAAHLIAALTEGTEFATDTVSTQELARIPSLYPKVPLVGFLSQYYLMDALYRRDKQSDAQRVKASAVKRYRDYLPVRDLKVYEIMTTSPPYGWKEIEALNAWNPSRFVAAPDGSRESGRDEWLSQFGWFCYQTFLDPGEAVSSAGTNPLSDEMRQYFDAVAGSCIDDPYFGSALKLLFENIHLFGRSVPFYWIDVAKLPPLSAEQRAMLLQVASDMRRVMASRTSKPEVKAAARLIAALTEGNEFPKDAVSTRELERIPALYRSQPLVGFLSQYYLFYALVRRGEEDEARRVAWQTVEKYSAYEALRHLAAYRDLQTPRVHPLPRRS